MNSAQLIKYWAEFAPIRKGLQARGVKSAEIEAHRHKLHERALGQDKSATKLTNREFDAVLRAFRADANASNFAGQMDVLNREEERLQAIHDRIGDLQDRCGIAGETTGVEAYFHHWFQGRRYADLVEEELQQLAALLARRAKQIKAPAKAASSTAPEPF
jgi:hypothetical protein